MGSLPVSFGNSVLVSVLVAMTAIRDEAMKHGPQLCSKPYPLLTWYPQEIHLPARS